MNLARGLGSRYEAALTRSYCCKVIDTETDAAFAVAPTLSGRGVISNRAGINCADVDLLQS